MRSFQGLDYLHLDQELTDEEKMVRTTVRAFAEEKVLPVINRCFDKGEFPKELIPEMGRLGFLGANLQGYGCPGLGEVSYGLISQELERGDAAIRSFASVQSSLVMYPILRFGSEIQRKKWLPRLAKGEAVGCFGLTEPDVGSDPSRLRTTATRSGGSWILRGSKSWITNGSTADVAVVWARREDGTICGFLVEKGTPGYATTDIKGKYSMRASTTSQLFFDDCKIPEENRLPEANGLKAALSCLTQARYGIAWGALGSAIACFDRALTYSQERQQFGKPIGAFQLTQEKLVWMLSEITKAQLLALRIGRLKERGEAKHTHISLAKMNNVWMARECARRAREILGANGITDEYHVIRHLMNLETVFTYEGTHEIHTLVLGKDLTGLDAFS